MGAHGPPAPNGLACGPLNRVEPPPHMDLLFLGTSAGAPTRTRNVSATAVIAANGKGWYLVDCGEATQHQLLRTPLSVHDLRALFITHVHGDHCFGIPGLLASAAMGGRRTSLPVIAPRALHDWIRQSLAVSDSHLPFTLDFQPVETLAPWTDEGLQVDTVALSHRVPSHAFVFSERCPAPRLDTLRLEADGVPRGPLWGALARGQTVMHAGRTWLPEDYRLGSRPPRRVIVAGDNDTPELLTEVARGADVLVHEATFTEPVLARSGSSYGHSTAARVARFAQQVGVHNLVLTHFSARYQANPTRSPSIADIRQEAAACYDGRLMLAQDLQRLRLDRQGVLVPADTHMTGAAITRNNT